MWARIPGRTGRRSAPRWLAVRGALGSIAAFMGVVAIGASCSHDVTGATASPVTEFGAPVAVGNGTARSYLVRTGATPTELGIELSAGALDSLPTAPLMGGYEFLVALPADNPTQYQVIGLNWNPTGHPPPMVYTVPHFDFHFYMQSLADRNAIAPTDPAFATEAANLPSAQFRPPGYVADPPANAIPHMGLHWTDSTAVEFHGQPFTRTFIVGSWNGQFTFFEPMVTRAYLLTHPVDLVAVRGATAHQAPGFYPTEYRVSWNATGSVWHIALAGLSP